MISGRLGHDSADAALNRPALILTAPEVTGLRALARARQAVELGGLIAANGPVCRAAGAGQLPGLRRELRRLLGDMPAEELPDRLALALSLQRLDTACATAQEFGFTLYLTLDSA